MFDHFASVALANALFDARDDIRQAKGRGAHPRW
jgi:hypothetical protein